MVMVICTYSETEKIMDDAVSRRETGRVNTLAEFDYSLKLSIIDRFLQEEDVVLDVGGGTGHYTAPLARSGHSVCLLELSSTRCYTARLSMSEMGVEENVRIINGNKESLPISANRFDAVVCLDNTLSHVGFDLSEQLSEFHRVLRPDGTLIVTVASRALEQDDFARALLRFSGDNLVEKLYDIKRNKKSRENLYKDDHGEVYKFSAEEIVDSVEENGFSVVETRPTGRYSMFMDPLISKAWRSLKNRKALLEYEQTVGKLDWFRNHGNMHLVVAVRR